MLLLNTVFVALQSFNLDKHPLTTPQQRMGLTNKDGKATKSSLQEESLRFTIDRVGRRRTIYWGSYVLSAIRFIIGSLYRGALDHPTQKEKHGTAPAAKVFV